MRVLLTGSNGFLGRNITATLQWKHNVIQVPSSHWDLRNQSTVNRLLSQQKPDVIVHAAGTVGGIGANKENPGKFMYENLIMGTNIIHGAKEHKVSKLVMIGTVCAYPKHTTVPFKEEDLWNGYPEGTNAPYGIAKKTLMKLVETYHEQHGLNAVNLIPVNMYGPHDHFNLTSSHVIPAMVLKLHSAIIGGDKSITLWGTGRASREFLYAEDCGDAISRAIDMDVGPEPINIGTGQEVTIATLAATLADIMGFDGEILYDDTKPDGQPRRCLDVSRASERLGFNATTELTAGLIKTVKWFRENKV